MCLCSLSFLLLVLLRYNWLTALYKFWVYSTMICVTYIMKWLLQVQWASTISCRYRFFLKFLIGGQLLYSFVFSCTTMYISCKYTYSPSLLRLPASPHPTPKVVTEHQAELPELYSISPQRERTCAHRGEGEGGIHWENGTDIYTAPYVK